MIRNYFGFSQKETNGTILLLFILILSIIIPWIYEYAPSRKLDNTKDNKIRDSLVLTLEKLDNEAEIPIPDGDFYPFDPNKINTETWLKFGLDAKIAKRIQNYLAKGGKFRKKTDLKRVYDFPEDLYIALEPYIQIENNFENKSKKYKKYPSYKNKSYDRDKEENFASYSGGAKDTNKKFYAKQKAKIQSFDINIADTVQLKKLRGIGEKRALSIIKYRERLGGFADISQIDEIYTLDTMAKNSLKKYVYISPNSWKKIKINTATEEELKQHIYIGYKLAKVIINYRKQHGKIQSVEDLAKIKAIEPEKVQKIAWYLIFD
ncbi:MAG: helix-hairpin-helix domain-containing protein [Thermonemataceae bacterium]|nr:helix-hairpin-helix domain-containing protein [Thermonemataceae bacterium]